MLSDKKGVVEMYREDPRAAKYRQMDKDKNGGHLPEDTVINTNICFCLVRPKYDQCADPIYTMLNANLKVWHVLLNPTLTLKQPTLLLKPLNDRDMQGCSTSLWVHSATDLKAHPPFPNPNPNPNPSPSPSPSPN